MRYFLSILFILISGHFTIRLYAQSKYFVVFTDKDGVSFQPENYFDAKALERRKKLNYPLNHWTDKPVKSEYIAQIRSLCDSVGRSLRWINAVVGFIEEDNVSTVASFPFVKEVLLLENYNAQLAMEDEELTQGKMRLAKAQIARMQGEIFIEMGLNGRGKRIAILDAGFPGVNTLPYYKHLRDSNQIIAHYDFVRNKPDTYRGHRHGTMVLSNIAGMIDSLPLGMAVKSEFLLARTESILKEGISDEENWLAAVEWADKNGADIINSSLGYTKRLYFRKDMDGKTSLISKAANMAASKGILVINSAGNEGGDIDWITIGSPADADSVLAVGGISPWTNIHSSWSSYGPSADGRMKPNICAFGQTIVTSKDGIEELSGTSFASPLMTGFAACAWSAYPDLTNMEIFEMLEKAGEFYPYYDYAHGYGVPLAIKILDLDTMDIDTTFKISSHNSKLIVTIQPEYFNRATLFMERYYSIEKDEIEGFNYQYGDEMINLDENAFLHYADHYYRNPSSGLRDDKCDYFLYKVISRDNEILRYFVIGVEQEEVLNIPLTNFESGQTIEMYYKGFIDRFIVK